MVHLVHFHATLATPAAELDRAKIRVRLMSTAYFPLDAKTVLVASQYSASALADELKERYPMLHILVVRQRNSWKSFGLSRLAEWLQGVEDEF